MKTFCNKIIKNNQGFTILETLVAISILAVAIATVMGIIQSSLIINSSARNQLTAKYLGEEGIEYIRNVRDQAVKTNPSGWTDTMKVILGAVCGSITDPNNTAQCDVDPIHQTTTAATPLLFDSTTGLYNHQTGSPSKFTRSITITPADGPAGTPYSLRVHATISWTENFGPQTFVVDEYLFEWH